MNFWSPRNRRRKSRRNPWQAVLERLEDRTLLAAPTVDNPIANQTANFGAAFEFTVPSNTFEDADGANTLTYSASGLPSWLTFTAATRVFSGTPTSPTDAGISNITVTVSDGTDTANDAFTMTVGNAVPSFTKGADQTSLEDATSVTVMNWATNISQGVNESGQTVNFIVSNNKPGLFSVAPAISPDGTLTYTPAANANDSATITVFIHDNGGTASGGIDTSAAQTFTITITAVNDVPSFTKGQDLVVPINAASQTVNGWATNISAGPSDESSQTLTFLVTTSNPLLFTVPPAISAAGVLTYTPTAGLIGTATVTVKLKDNGGTINGGVDTSAEQTFTISIGTAVLPVAPGGNAVYTASANAKLRAFVVNGLLSIQINGVQYPTYVPATVTSLTINGGSKNDEIDLSGLDPAIYTGLVGTTVKIKGNAGNDRLVGSFANDSIDAGSGNDTLTGGDGDDTLIGNAGTDRLVETATADLTLDDTSLAGLGTDRLVTLEVAELTADDAGRSIDASAFTRGAVTLIGGAGNDTLIGGSKNDAISGRDGDDELVGGAGNDTVLGGFGNDSLEGGLGKDLLIGGFDDDTIDGGDGRDTVVGGNGGAARGGDGVADAGDDLSANAANEINEAFKKLFAFE